jgi:Fic family protein
MVDSLLDDFFGNLTSSKWAKMTKTSSDTALRDIQDLINKGILIKEQGGGRSTNYSLVIPEKQ